MAIYTKTGDKGETSLFGGKRILKSDLHLEACGTLDELSSFIGLLIVKLKNKKRKQLLLSIQEDLYEIMAVFSGANINIVKLSSKIQLFEQEIDNIQSKLPKLNRFILPGGTEIASITHIARAICRRAERNSVSFYSSKRLEKNIKKYRLIILSYLNRLSDLLFVLARETNKGRETIIK